jgi:hypothetical protein
VSVSGVLCFQLLYLRPRYKFHSSVGAHEDKTATLSDADTVWADIRHMHMKEAIEKLMADFNRFLQDSAGFNGYVFISLRIINNRPMRDVREGAATLGDMKDMLANLPQYQDQREKVPFGRTSPCVILTGASVFITSKHGSRMYGYLRTR